MDVINFDIIEQVIDAKIEEINYNVEAGDAFTILVDNTDRVVYRGVCGEVINGGRVVYLNNGKLYLASSGNILCKNKIVGISEQAGEVNEAINVVTYGLLKGLSGLSETNYYLGLNGQLTTTEPTTGLYMPVGFGLNENEFYVKLENNIIR